MQELVSVGFVVEFILDHLHEIARAFFIKKVQPTIDATDRRIEALRKEAVDLEGHRECLLSSVGGSLEIRLLFPDFVDYVVSLLFPFPYSLI